MTATSTEATTAKPSVSTAPSKPVPSTTGTSTEATTTKPPVSTAPSKPDWLSQPCHDQEKLPQCPWSNNPVLLVSLDGFKAEYVNRNRTPAIQKLRQCGVHTPYMRSAYPTLTFPNHYTIVTGLYPESHGIVGNSMYDPKTNESFKIGGSQKFNPHWWGGEPLWATAKKQGKKTASYYWVGSEMNISGYQPDIWFPYGNVPYEERVDTVLQWLERKTGDRPDFITLYMDEPDHTGHGSGPDSPEVDEMLERVDSVIKYLMDGLFSRQMDHCVNLIVLADHGMESVSSERVVDLKHYLPEVADMLVYQGTTGYIHRHYNKEGSIVHEITNPMPTDEIVEALECKNPHLNVFSKSNIPVRHHYTRNDRIGDVVVDIEASWLFSAGTYHSNLKGNHGYDNIYKSMHALFLAHGPAFKQEFEADPFENIELYNLMADLLEITPAPNNGTKGSLQHLLRTPPNDPTPGNNRKQCPTGQTPLADGLCQCDDNNEAGISSVNNDNLLFPFGMTLTFDTARSVCVRQSAGVATIEGTLPHVALLASFNLQKSTNPVVSSCSPDCSDNKCQPFTNDGKGFTAACLFNTGVSLSGTERGSISVPMLQGFKDGIWTFLETLVQDYVTKYQNVHVTTGPIYDYTIDGIADPNNRSFEYVNDDQAVPVPSHYFAILTKCSSLGVAPGACEPGNIQVISFVLPHQNKSANCLTNRSYLLNNVARVRDVELLTGTRFFNYLNISMAARLRTFLPGALWESHLVTPWVDLPCPVPDDPKCPAGNKPLLLISLDGFRADYLDRKLTPVIQRLSQCGVHTPFMRSVYPTVTFPNHYSIVTGLYPESHGIISNTMYDADIGEVFTLSAKTSKDPRWWKGEPLWITAKKQGKKTATYFWPGSEVNISGIYPDEWKPYDGKAGYTERVYEVLNWLSLPEETRPDFVTLYFDEPDHAGHGGGPDSEQVNGMLETVDELINILMTNLYDNGLHNCVNMIIVADHGMSPQSCDRAVEVKDYLPEVSEMFSVDHTLGQLFPQFHQVDRYTVEAQTKEYKIEDIVANLTCKDAAMKVFTKETLPRRHHYTNNVRIADVLLDMKDTWLVLTKTTNFCNGGNHGWDNTYKNMHALFLAHGPAFRNNFTAEPFENIELYDLMSEILDITPAPNNGTRGSLHYILRNPDPLNPADAVAMQDKCKQPVSLSAYCNCPNVQTTVKGSSLYEDTAGPLFGEPRENNVTYCALYQQGASVGYSHQMSAPVWVSTVVDNTSHILLGDQGTPCILDDSDVPSPGHCSWQVGNETLELTPMLGSGISFDNTVVYTRSTVLPLYTDFKTGVWKYLTGLVQDFTSLHGNISITSGPIYDYNNDGLWEGITNNTKFVDGTNSLPIPTHVYVTLIKCRTPGDTLPCSGRLDILPFIIPHLPQIPNCLRPDEYLKDNVGRIRDVELLTGLEFMTSYNVTMSARLRTYLPEGLWESSLIKDWQELPCPHADKCTSDYRPLLLISLDGFRADYLLRNVTPTISRLSKCGVHAPYMRSVYPTKTFPNHYSIVTGLYPESHGIIDNNMYDLDIKERFYLGSDTSFDPRWWGGEPFWLTAKNQGHKTATYFWPGSDVKIDGKYPDIWKKYDGSVSYTSRVRELLTWLQLPEDQRPNFLTLYFDQPDLAGHKYGPSNEEKIAESLDNVDKTIDELMTGLFYQNMHNCVNLVIIADHGMSDVSCKQIVRLNNHVDYDYMSANTYVWEGAFGRIANQYIYNRTVKHVTPADSPASVDELVTNLTCADPHLNVYSKENLPVRHHYSNNDRIDNTILDMEDGWLVTRKYINTCRGGNHGYDNLDKSMEALFLAYGPAFKWNMTIEPFENIELYNLFSDILNVTAAPNNGTAGSLDHILQRPPVRAATQSQHYERSTLRFDKVDSYRNFVKASPCFADSCDQITDKMIDDVFQSSASDQTVEGSKHLPFGIPRLAGSALRTQNQSLFSQDNYVMGVDEKRNTTMWISQTVKDIQIRNNSRDCILPDPRMERGTFEAANLCSDSTGQGTVSLVWKEFPDGAGVKLDTLSTTVFKMHQSFIDKVWLPLQSVVQQIVRKYNDMNILSGPVYDFNHDSQTDDPQSMRDPLVPSHVYVVLTRCAQVGSSIAGCERYTSAAYILPNSANITICKTFEEYMTDNEARVRDVEIATGLEFYTSLPREQAVRIRTFLPSGLWLV